MILTFFPLLWLEDTQTSACWLLPGCPDGIRKMRNKCWGQWRGHLQERPGQSSTEPMERTDSSAVDAWSTILQHALFLFCSEVELSAFRTSLDIQTHGKIGAMPCRNRQVEVHYISASHIVAACVLTLSCFASFEFGMRAHLMLQRFDDTCTEQPLSTITHF